MIPPLSCPNDLGSKSSSNDKQPLCEEENYQFRKIYTGHEFYTFYFSDLELAKMTWGQNQDTFSGQKRLLYE